MLLAVQCCNSAMLLSHPYAAIVSKTYTILVFSQARCLPCPAFLLLSLVYVFFACMLQHPVNVLETLIQDITE